MLKESNGSTPTRLCLEQAVEREGSVLGWVAAIRAAPPPQITEQITKVTNEKNVRKRGEPLSH